jgi:hypothetical protein
MDDAQVFWPTGILLTTSRKWIFGLLLFAVLAAVVHIYAPEMLLAVPILAAAAFIYMLMSKQPVSVTISRRYRTLHYTYQNCWGNNRTVIVDLSNAGGYYEFEQFGRNSWGWHLLLYNGSYFRNRVSIKQKENGGFTKKQLDQMVALVHELR